MERTKSTVKDREKKSLMSKTLERCKSLGNKRGGSRAAHVQKSKSWPRVAPEGCVTVYVGPEKERFVIRTECVNHPLFKELLDEAERVYGYAREGPIELPCDVDRFDRVLWEIDGRDEEAVSSPLCSFPASPMRGFGKAHAGYRVIHPSRLVVAGRF